MSGKGHRRSPRLCALKTNRNNVAEREAEDKRGRKRKLRTVENLMVNPVEGAEETSTENVDRGNTEEPSNTSLPTALPEKRVLDVILNELLMQDSYELFVQPVDPREVKNYYDVIKEPMDLSTMKLKVDEGKYSTLEEFERDASLLSINATSFNPKNTVYHQEGLKMQKLSTQIFHCLRTSPKTLESELSKLRSSNSISSGNNEDGNGGSSAKSRHLSLGSSSNGRQCMVNSPAGPKNNTPGDNKKAPEDTNVLCKGRRSTYKTWPSSLRGTDAKTASTLGGQPLQLLPADERNFNYKESLSQFVTGLGPTAQMVAQRKIQECENKVQQVQAQTMPSIHPSTPSTPAKKSPATHKVPHGNSRRIQSINSKRITNRASLPSNNLSSGTPWSVGSSDHQVSRMENKDNGYLESIFKVPQSKHGSGVASSRATTSERGSDSASVRVPKSEPSLGSTKKAQASEDAAGMASFSASLRERSCGSSSRVTPTEFRSILTSNRVPLSEFGFGVGSSEVQPGEYCSDKGSIRVAPSGFASGMASVRVPLSEFGSNAPSAQANDVKYCYGMANNRVPPSEFASGMESTVQVPPTDFTSNVVNTQVQPGQYVLGMASVRAPPSKFASAMGNNRVPPSEFAFGNESVRVPPTEFGSKVASTQVQPSEYILGTASVRNPPSKFASVLGNNRVPPSEFVSGTDSVRVPPTKFGSNVVNTQVQRGKYRSGTTSVRVPPSKLASVMASIQIPPSELGSNEANPRVQPRKGCSRMGGNRIPPSEFASAMGSNRVPPREFSYNVVTNQVQPAEYLSGMGSIHVAPSQFTYGMTNTRVPLTEFGSHVTTTEVPPSEFGSSFSTINMPASVFGSNMCNMGFTPSEFRSFLPSHQSPPNQLPLSSNDSLQPPFHHFHHLIDLNASSSSQAMKPIQGFKLPTPYGERQLVAKTEPSRSFVPIRASPISTENQTQQRGQVMASLEANHQLIRPTQTGPFSMGQSQASLPAQHRAIDLPLMPSHLSEVNMRLEAVGLKELEPPLMNVRARKNAASQSNQAVPSSGNFQELLDESSLDLSLKL